GPRLERQPNLVVGRTFAKAHGLAGLRVGALVAHADTIAALRRLMLPFSVNACAIAALEAALEDRAYLDWYVAQSVESRTLVYNFCRRHDLPFWPSEANFVLFRAGADAGVLVDAAARRGVLLRNESHAPGCAGCVRMTAGVVEHTKTALTVLEDALASRAH
ncbi:MAG TPA: aminotransferase class I/II-fold pyridoxal phosphate-dependent enzyme, partial [Vicinamibacterales bacterium]|nr:aminotransferase class I/II-fold pyridoxal phosphate-dependent enzyme [Vicinamibacterales bacterium]